MSPDEWTDKRIDDLVRRHEDDIRLLQADVRLLDQRVDGFSSGRRLTTVQLLGLVFGFLGPIFVALIAALALVVTKGPT